jgi:methionyl-tRNA synthetase
VNGWGNLVNRSLNLVSRNGGAIPAPGELTGEDSRALEASRAAFATVGGYLDRSQQKAAITEAMRVVGEANKYLSDQAPWNLKDDPARRDSVLHVALQLVDDAKALLTPFLPESCDTVDRMLGGDRPWAGQPELREVEDLDGGPGYPGADGRLRHRGGLGVAAHPGRAADRQAAAPVRQARPVRDHRGAAPAGGGRAAVSAPLAEGRRA